MEAGLLPVFVLFLGFFSRQRLSVCLSVCTLNQLSSKGAGAKREQESPDLDASLLEP